MKRMKFAPQALLASLCLLFLVTGCKKDDEAPPRNSEFTANETTVDLTNGFIETYGENSDGSYDWDLIITSESLDSATIASGVGFGSLVYLDLNTDLETGLKAGTYEWSETRAPFTIVDASIGVNYDLDAYSGDYLGEAMDGSVIVSFDGNETIIDFELTMLDSMEVSGYYKGTLSDL